LKSQSLARKRGQQQIDALHLLYSLLSQEGSIVLNLLTSLGIDLEDLKNKTKNSLDKISSIITPQVFGQVYLTQDMAKVLEGARQESVKMGDEYISVEHLFLSLLNSNIKAKDILEQAKRLPSVGPLLEKESLNYNTAFEYFNRIRGGEKITDPNPESKYQVVEKYARNLTSLAKQGKLDPVIGREKEIRRLMQVLSRRTKNNPVLIGEAGVGKQPLLKAWLRELFKQKCLKA